MDARQTRSQSNDGSKLVSETVLRHSAALLRTARRVSICREDAEDAYQRGLEVFLRNAGRLTPQEAVPWLHTVVRNEALRVRKLRTRASGPEMAPLADEVVAVDSRSPEDHALESDRIARANEALRRLKSDQRRALWLQAEGLSYEEIGQSTGWTRTKVNRSLTEGRRAFFERYAGIERGEECERWEPMISALLDGEATGEQIAELRPHIKRCQACRATMREMYNTGGTLHCVLPAGLIALLIELGPDPAFGGANLAAIGGTGAAVGTGGGAVIGGSGVATSVTAGSGGLISGTLAKVATTVAVTVIAGASVVIEGSGERAAQSRPSGLPNAFAVPTAAPAVAAQPSPKQVVGAKARKAGQKSAAAGRRRKARTARRERVAARNGSQRSATTIDKQAASGEFAPPGEPTAGVVGRSAGASEFGP